MEYSKISQVLVTGGAGYVGAVLIPKLLEAAYRVRVLDLFIFGEDVLETVRQDRNLQLIGQVQASAGHLSAGVRGPPCCMMV